LQAREEESRTTIYSRVSEVTYQLKMKTSRAVFTQVQQKAGAFPFNIRMLEDEKRARMGLQEAVQHGLVRPYDVQYVNIIMTSGVLTDCSLDLHPQEATSRVSISLSHFYPMVQL
jgi:hypothetical protein